MKTILVPAAMAALALLTSCKARGFHGDDPAQSASVSGRNYAVDVERVWQALQSAMKDLDLNVDKADHDALGGQMSARRATGDPVYVRVKSASPGNTTVDVSVEPADRNMAQLIQDKIAEKLGADRPGAGGLGAGSVVDGSYDNNLEECAGAAERALKALSLPVSAREKHDIWMILRSKHLDTVPVSVKLERTSKDQTHVTFTVGTSPGEDNALLANRLKKEFESALTQRP